MDIRDLIRPFFLFDLLFEKTLMVCRLIVVDFLAMEAAWRLSITSLSIG
jgi:hypothetical protein